MFTLPIPSYQVIEAINSSPGVLALIRHCDPFYAGRLRPVEYARLHGVSRQRVNVWIAQALITDVHVGGYYEADAWIAYSAPRPAGDVHGRVKRAKVAMPLLRLAGVGDFRLAGGAVLSASELSGYYERLKAIGLPQAIRIASFNTLAHNGLRPTT